MKPQSMRLVKTEDDPRHEQLGPVGAEVEAILHEAVERAASDLHLDPTPQGTRCRLRVDGHFEPGPAVTPGLHDRIMARVKVLAGLVVYRRDEIQEGSIRRDGGVDLRVSILPTVSGEKLTVRIFDPRTRPLRLEELGFRPAVESALNRMTDRQRGTVLVCGPSGSGKTTTLYAMLHRILQTRGTCSNICSVEDPVELALDGVHQMPVQREQGRTFARGLAALLRQDPEVLLVGEIRDGETASIAVEAGMTGHLVLTSVHAGSAGEALTRLLDLSVEPYLAATSVKAVVAQRLVRKNCGRCTREDRPDAVLLERFDVADVDDAEWRAGAGCDVCRGTGFSGRLPIAEVLEVDRTTAERIIARDEASVFSGGLLDGATLLNDGIGLARRGETTLEEIARVVGSGSARE